MALAYYNENDPYCAAWLRNLIAEHLIAPGHVDDRDIRDVRPTDLAPYTQCHFFAGFGGWSRALRLAAWPDHRPVWTGSCPCQPFSQAGQRRGFADERHLWPFWHWLISQRRPAIVLGEQVASAAVWLRLVRSDLETLDYAVGAIPIEAASAGADHLRDRYWFMGYSSSTRLALGSIAENFRGNVWQQGAPIAATGIGSFDAGVTDREGWQSWQSSSETMGHRDSFEPTSHRILPDAEQFGLRGEGPATFVGAASGVQGANTEWQRLRFDAWSVRGIGETEWVIGTDGKCRRVKPGVRLLAHGIPARVAKLRAFGNAIDPRPAQAFIESVMDILP